MSEIKVYEPLPPSHKFSLNKQNKAKTPPLDGPRRREDESGSNSGKYLPSLGSLVVVVVVLVSNVVLDKVKSWLVIISLIRMSNSRHALEDKTIRQMF